MATNKEITEKIGRVLKDQKLGVMATYEPEQPYLSLIAFCNTPDLTKIIFATDRNTRKYANLKRNPRAAILFDNRIVAHSDFRLGIAVTAYGDAQDVEESILSVLRHYYLEKHPTMEGFVNSPSTALLCLNVEYFQVVEDIQKVTIVKMF